MKNVEAWESYLKIRHSGIKDSSILVPGLLILKNKILNIQKKPVALYSITQN